MKILKIMTTTMGLFLKDGCIQLGCVMLGLMKYDNEGLIHDMCTILVVSCIVRITSQRHSTGNPTLSCACIECYL